MKKQFKFFSVLFAAAAMMASCSNDEPMNPGTSGEDDAAFGDSYLTVSLQMPTAIGSRAAADAENGSDKYDNGEENEGKVTNAIFFFFDKNNNCIDIQKVTDISSTEKVSVDPYVSHVGTKEVRLKSGLKYEQVAVVLNSENDINDLRNIKNFEQLELRSKNYVSQIVTEGKDKRGNQAMSNSVFFNTTNADVKPANEDKYTLVPITSENIYTSAERAEITAPAIVPKDKKAVMIYVERVVAKVKVSEPKFKMLADEATNNNEEFYISKDDDGKKSYKITVYNNNDLSTDQIIVRPIVKGVSLNVLTTSARLLKPIDATQVGYGEGTDYNAFRWNDPRNRRCYWASTDQKSTDDMDYFSWDDVVDKGLTGFTKYIHPNTLAFEPTDKNENNSLNTKVMVLAELHKYSEGGDDLGRLDFVRYGSEYMLTENLMAQVANYMNNEIDAINWGKENFYSPAQEKVLTLIVHNTLAENLLTGSNFTINLLNLQNNVGAYEGRIYTKYFDEEKNLDYPEKLFVLDYQTIVDAKYENYFKYTQEELDKMTEEEKESKLDQIKDDYKSIFEVTEIKDGKPYYGNLATLLERANETIAQTVIGALSTTEGNLNNPQILYWKDGKTYYYTTIKHQGFYGLTGVTGNDDYLNGVVRNHIYDITLNGIYGLGTPVIDPKQPIDPERPTIDRPSYLKAQINILPWRVVEQSATLH